MRPSSEVSESSVAVMVGEEEEKLQRVVVPLERLNHKLFRLLFLDDDDDDDAQEEYKFKYDGLLHIYCDLDLFLYVNMIIDRNIPILY